MNGSIYNKINIQRSIYILLVIGCALCSGCLNVGDARADRDAVVGKSSKAGLSVDVVDGLAAVRALEPGQLTLWGQAPSLTWTLKTDDTAQDWSVEVRNSMRKGQLTIQKGNNAPVPVDRLSSTIPTIGKWSIPLDANATYTMHLKTPDADMEDTFRFVVFADIQNRLNDVQDIYSTMKQDSTIHFGLISGDLTRRGSKEQMIQFQEEMKSLPFPCFATLGNHELGNSETLFHDYFGRGNFSFEYKGTRFTLLDSASARIAPDVYPWLDTWLDKGKDKLHMVIMHIPPLDEDGHRNGAFASRAEAHKLLSKLAGGDVDMTIYGHVHTYAAYSNAGIPAFISGGGGAIPMRLDGIGRHYMSIDADFDQKIFVPGVVRVYPE